MKQLLPYVRRVAAGDPPDDAGLLASFAARRDAEAFALLVRRHGPLVRGVCRRWLRDAADVDDAFQATFLVLVRRANTIAQPAQLAGWLHGVARRTARSLRSRLTRSRRRFVEIIDVQAPAVPDAELGRLLDDEIARLPEKYRLPVVLCHLQGLSRREAARLLACPEGTLSVRLARALDLLRRRLLRCGVVPGAAAVLLAPASVEAVSPLLLKSTVRAAVQAAAPERIVALTEGVLRMFLIERLARAAACLLAVVVLFGGGALLMNQLTGGSAALAEAPAKPAPPIVLALKTAADGAKIETIDVTEGDDRVTVHSLPALSRYLKRVRLDKSASGTIVLRAGNETKYSSVVSVIDSCRAAGFEKVMIDTAPVTAKLDAHWVDVQWNLEKLETVQVPLKVDVLWPLHYERIPATIHRPPLKFETIRYNYAKELETAKNVEQVQQEWIGDLSRFLEQSPDAAEAPEAMLQLALTLEFTAKQADAKKWYERLVKQFPASREAVKARGSLKRLTSVGRPFELESTALTGKRFRVSNVRGKVVAVYYWATWNSTTRNDFAKLQALRTNYAGKFEVIGVNLDDQPAVAQEFVRHSPLKDAMHVRENGGPESRLASDYGITVAPTLFLLDREGKVVRHDLTIEQLENEVKKLVK